MKIETNTFKEEIIKIPVYTINDIEITNEFLIKNNLIEISYGGGGYLDTNKPWLVRFKNKEVKRYSENNFLIIFNNLIN